MKKTNKHRIKQTRKKNKIRSGGAGADYAIEFASDMVLGLAYMLSVLYVGLIVSGFVLAFVIACYTLYAFSEIAFIGGKKLMNLSLRWLKWLQGYDYKQRINNITEKLFPNINRHNKKVKDTIKGEIINFHDEFKKKEDYIFNEEVFKLRLGLKILNEKYEQDEIDDKIKNNTILSSNNINEKEKLAFQWLIEEKKLSKLDKNEYLKKIMSGWCPETKKEQEEFELFKKHDHISLVIDITLGDVKKVLDNYKNKTKVKSGKSKKKITIKKKKKKKKKNRILSGAEAVIVKETKDDFNLDKQVEEKIKKEGANELKVAEKQESQSKKLGQTIIATNKSLIQSIGSLRNKDDSDSKRLVKAGGILAFISGVYGLLTSGSSGSVVDTSTGSANIIDGSGSMFEGLTTKAQYELSQIFPWTDSETAQAKAHSEESFAHSVKQYINGIFNDQNFGVFTLIKTIRQVIHKTFLDANHGILPHIWDGIMANPEVSAVVGSLAIAGGTFTAVKTIIEKRQSILNSPDLLEKKDKIYDLKRQLETEIYSTPDENQKDKKYMIDIIDNNLVELNEFSEKEDDIFIDDFIKHIQNTFSLKILTSLKICDPELTDGQLEIKTENILDILKTKVNTYGELEDIYKEYIFKFNIGNMPSVKLKRKQLEKEREKIKSGKSSHKKKKKSKKKKSSKIKSKK